MNTDDCHLKGKCVHLREVGLIEDKQILLFEGVQSPLPLNRALRGTSWALHLILRKHWTYGNRPSDDIIEIGRQWEDYARSSTDDESDGADRYPWPPMMHDGLNTKKDTVSHNTNWNRDKTVATCSSSNSREMFKSDCRQTAREVMDGYKGVIGVSIGLYIE